MSAANSKSTLNELLGYALTPLSWCYGFVTTVRNKMFDWGILPQEEFDVPVVCVGNLTVGGTGKTPHVEYIVRKLATDYRIAVLSRGYKRKTRGFILANSKSTPDTIGDEPYQIYQKYGMLCKVAVCENRRKGIRYLMAIDPTIELIVLDDGLQHRFVKPKVSILLSDYNHPVYEDKLLPLGRLRENLLALNRADMVVVTKCPPTMSPLDYRMVYKNMDLMAFQKLHFSTYIYGGLRPVFPDDSPYQAMLSSLTRRDSILLLTGIANPRGFIRYFKQFDCRVKICHYSDHHNFSRRDLQDILRRFETMKGERKIIVTTEKDAVRLSTNPYFPHRLKPLCYYLPISVEMNNFGDSDFITDLRQLIDAKG